MSWLERIATRGDMVLPPDNLGKRIREGAGAISAAIFQWFKQTGNDPGACTVTPTVTPTAKTLTIAIVVTAP